jgi:hypothetical protein
MTTRASPQVGRALGVIQSVEAGTVILAERAARTVRQTSGRLELRLAALRARLDPEARSFVEQVRAGLATGSIGQQVANQTDLRKLIAEQPR